MKKVSVLFVNKDEYIPFKLVRGSDTILERTDVPNIFLVRRSRNHPEKVNEFVEIEYRNARL